jgi:hypothetical protein
MKERDLTKLGSISKMIKIKTLNNGKEVPEWEEVEEVLEKITMIIEIMITKDTIIKEVVIKEEKVVIINNNIKRRNIMASLTKTQMNHLKKS